MNAKEALQAAAMMYANAVGAVFGGPWQGQAELDAAIERLEQAESVLYEAAKAFAESS